MEKLFRDVISGSRSHAFNLRISDEEHKLLEEKAQAEGVHVTTLIRRCIRRVLITQPGQKAEKAS